MNKLKVLSLFSGIGAFEKALSNLGVDYELVGFSEIDKYASKSYCAIHNVEESLNLGDITKIDLENLPKADLITHGSPCTSFSLAGKGAGGDKGSGTQSSLMWYSVEIINKVRPKYVIWENVKNVLSKKHRHNFDLYIDTLDKLGYKSYFEVLNAKHYGVPQNRERIFVVSILEEHEPLKFPQPIELNLALKDILEVEVEEKYYINKKWHFTRQDEQKHDVNEIAQIDNIKYKSIRSITDTNKVCRCLDTMGGGQREPKILVPQATKSGYIEMELPGIADLSYPNSKTRRGRVQEGGKISPCLATTSQDICYIESNAITDLDMDILSQLRIRKLTPKECWRLMGFSDEDIEKCISIGMSNTQLYKQAGNSIVVKVLEGIFRNLLC